MSEEILNNMDEEDYEYSIASQLSYDYFDNDNNAEKTQEILDTYMEGYTFDPELSYDNASVIVRPNGTAILAFRGTRPTNLDDLNADASILTGLHKTNIPHPRFTEALDHYTKVKNKYNSVDITGHSLGGTLADYVGRSTDNKTIVFNPGETPLSTSLITGGISKTRVYRTNTFDIVSFSNSLYPHAESIRVVPQTDPASSWLGSHNLTNFLPSIDMLPLSKQQDIFIAPTIIKEEEKRELKTERDICETSPYLFPERCLPKLKIKKKSPP
jgi:hypothetical protein